VIVSEEAFFAPLFWDFVVVTIATDAVSRLLLPNASIHRPVDLKHTMLRRIDGKKLSSRDWLRMRWAMWYQQGSSKPIETAELARRGVR
jgi:hypothetical protein